MNEFESLDPEDWEKMRRLGHEMVNDMVGFIRELKEKPVWQPMSDDQKKGFFEALPQTETAPEQVYGDFKKMVLPYVMGNPHPRFWAWYMGSSTFLGSLADFLTSVTNSNAGAGNHVGQLLEDQVISWLCDVIGYPKEASGILVSGGSMANFVGLAVARHVKAGYDVRTEGVRKGLKQMTYYASNEVHSCNQKALELLGIGSANFRKIRVNDDLTINLQALRDKINEDIQSGFQPICVIGTAGTVNTGAIDDIESLSDICEEFDLWFHVDGAIGAIAMLSDKVRPLLKGVEKSDSIALDLHKWMHVPFEAGCVLVRNRSEHRDAFHLTPEYLEQNVRGLASGNRWYSEYGLQLSRRLRALKVWMTIKEHGAKKLGRMISRNVAQAYYLADLIGRQKKLELVADVGLDIVCFRYHREGVSRINELNKEILILIQERGIAVPSYTTLNGIYCIRVAIANHRSTFEDFDLLIKKIIEIGDEIVKGY